jgi:hypothetical protein
VIGGACLLVMWGASLGCLPSRTPTAVAPLPATQHVANNAKPCAFEDRAQQLGVDFTYRNGREADHSTILESLGGGVGWLDFDRDGWPDLLLPGGGGLTEDQRVTGLPSALYRNLGGRSFVGVSSDAALATAALYTHGVAIADYDHDGFQDILFTGYGPVQLWKNLGDGTFVEVGLAAGLHDQRWSSSAGWADLNGDHDLDLYVAHYVNWSFQNHPVCPSAEPGTREICPPRSFEPLPDVVYFSSGDGSFRDATAEAGLRSDGKGLGVLLCDVEPDGDMDIYVANDTTDNFLYLNDGRGVFEEGGLSRGVALDDLGAPNGSMGVELCDFNRDGRPDIWVTNYERESNALYRNEGNAFFLHVSQRMGITDLGDLFVGFGTACEDFDGDGDQDLMIANGHVIKYPHPATRKQLPLLIEDTGERFVRMPAPPENYFAQAHEGRGLATADFDRDGDVDAAISNLNEPAALLENQFPLPARWVALTLVGTQSNRDAVGARVDFQSRGGVLHRQVVGGGSYLSHSSRTLHFAWAAEEQAPTIVIHWPAGLRQTVDLADKSGSYWGVEPRSSGDAAPWLHRVETEK